MKTFLRHERRAIARLAQVIATLLLAVGCYVMLTVLALVASGPAAAADTAADASAAVPQAAGPWADAFAALARQADAGSVDAARRALEMVQHGPRLYGMRFEADERRLRRWRGQLACAAPPCAAHA